MATIETLRNENKKLLILSEKLIKQVNKMIKKQPKLTIGAVKIV